METNKRKIAKTITFEPRQIEAVMAMVKARNEKGFVSNFSEVIRDLINKNIPVPASEEKLSA